MQNPRPSAHAKLTSATAANHLSASPRASDPCKTHPHSTLRSEFYDAFLFALSFYLRYYVLVSIPILLLFPYIPTVRVTQLHLTHLRISPAPRASFDLTLTLNLNVQNSCLYPLDYKSVVSSVSYRGRHLGSVSTVRGRRVKAWVGSNLEAVLRLEGATVVDGELAYLIEDLTKGSVPLEIVAELEGTTGLIIPVKVNISCSLNVNPKIQKIVHQDCYPE